MSSAANDALKLGDEFAGQRLMEQPSFGRFPFDTLVMLLDELPPDLVQQQTYRATLLMENLPRIRGQHKQEKVTLKNLSGDDTLTVTATVMAESLPKTTRHLVLDNFLQGDTPTQGVWKLELSILDCADASKVLTTASHSFQNVIGGSSAASIVLNVQQWTDETRQLRIAVVARPSLSDARVNLLRAWARLNGCSNPDELSDLLLFFDSRIRNIEEDLAEYAMAKEADAKEVNGEAKGEAPPNQPGAHTPDAGQEPSASSAVPAVALRRASHPARDLIFKGALLVHASGPATFRKLLPDPRLPPWLITVLLQLRGMVSSEEQVGSEDALSVSSDELSEVEVLQLLGTWAAGRPSSELAAVLPFVSLASVGLEDLRCSVRSGTLHPALSDIGLRRSLCAQLLSSNLASDQEEEPPIALTCPITLALFRVRPDRLEYLTCGRRCIHRFNASRLAAYIGSGGRP